MAKHRLAEIWRPRPARPDEHTTEPLRSSARERQERLINGLEQTLADNVKAFGSGDRETIGTQLRLAQAKLDAGSAADAITLLEQALEATDPDDVGAGAQRASATAALAGAYLSTRRGHAAIALYELLLSEPAATDRDGVALRIRLAVAHRSTGDASAAIERLQAVIGELEQNRVLPDRLLEAVVELGRTHVVAGNPREGASVYERALALADELHAAEHRGKLEIRLLLARALQQAGESAHAADACELLMSEAEPALGAEDRLTREVADELTLLRRFSVSDPSAQLGE